ncbi:serine/threonine-protein kinase haspin homolog [Oryza glaberrima]|uniref:serine/threonine-protein kinase haspin homolog n=1 Tax=Oryza glaberrima TaxID=4538 RepID=UPI00224C1673|nr:serine/threonine-protein kinase haspin homolog [Oryza glaberrima]
MATTRDLSAIDMAREAAAPGRTAGKASAPSGHHHAGARGGGGDLWSEIMASGGGGGAARIGVVYGRRRAAQEASRPRGAVDVRGVAAGEKRASFEPSKRTSWNRSLSIRGRESILFAPGTKIQPQQNPCRAQKRPPKPGNRVKRTFGGPPDLKKEKAYFEEVDAFELMEESPSPKNFGTWARGMEQNYIVHDLSAILERWKISKLAKFAASRPLFDIMETPVVPSVRSDCSLHDSHRTPEKDRGSRTNPMRRTIPSGLSDKTSIFTSFSELKIKEEPDDSSIPSLSAEAMTAFAQLLLVCNQSAPITLAEAFSTYCTPGSIVKLGEGTFGEAFRAGSTVCKVVPFDGTSLVNGETQKKTEEVLEEVLLCLTLNNLRADRGDNVKENSCHGFIETKDFWVCQGPYDPSLICAWEDWDAKCCSENDHPNDFSNEQCYIVFVQADGGRDLEKFALLDYNEACSLLVQVTAALAVAESACEFEHRDLHWGNILLDRDETQDKNHTMGFTLQGKNMCTRTFGLNVSIIDFTLSRINTGDAILFLDLSTDPALFEGPKRDKQAETYRKMKQITNDYWEGSFPKTNVVWLIYLVDIVLQKRYSTFTSKDDRELRAFKKRLAKYDSAKDCLTDSFFCDLLLSDEDAQPSTA